MGVMTHVCKDFISETEEVLFKKGLYARDKEEYCRYILAKVYNWIKFIYKIELRCIIATFFGTKTDYLLYKCYIADMRIRDLGFVEKFGFKMQDHSQKKQYDLNDQIFDEEIVNKKISQQQ